MKSGLPFEQLRKVLELEQSKGYEDKAVIGGLDSFLSQLGPAVNELPGLPSPGYKSLDKQRRQKWVEDALRSVRGEKPQREKPRQRKPQQQRPVRLPPTSKSGFLDSPITAVKGVNSRVSPRLHRLGLATVRDLLYFFPRRHIDYSSSVSISELVPETEQTVLAQIWGASSKKSSRGMWITEALVGDDTGMMQVTWFNQPYLERKLAPNSRIAMIGKAKIWKGNKVFQPSSFEVLDQDSSLEGALVPVYPLTEGVYPRQLRRIVRRALDVGLSHLKEFLPEEVRSRAGLMGLAEAIWQAHYPDNETSRDAARHRLAFDELLLVQVGLLTKKHQRREANVGVKLDSDPGYVERFLSSLSFELTQAQRRTLQEIQQDLARERPMSRLLQGDVGSGKTIVAVAGMLQAVASGCQAALMAPTEVVAEQHFRNVCGMLGGGEGALVRSCSFALPRPITVGLLMGSSAEKDKKELYHRAAEGDIDILIGTHALIQKKLKFHELGLAVVDEQHRFGVMQRLELRQKGRSPHVLVMSATPIPRTLALTLYGDLDVSLIDELPPGRQEIKTRWLGPEQRQSGYEFVRKQVGLGHQAFIICPLIEESESIESRAATQEYERLSKEVFPDLKLGLLHGRMSASEKTEVMDRFRSGELDILVSTTVLEVGVDVPNATVMVVEGADRFGLSQLHQLRGRVWRSSYQSYCILLSDQPSDAARERLSIMENTHNGFRLAEEDLKIRGPGEFFGTRQSGLPELKMAQLTDMELLAVTQKEAGSIVESDPQLEKVEHRALADEVARLWQRADG
ncbi:MAG: ATP-dependent DNA helicase RecG [Chloroflexota bacterium]